MKDIRSRCFVFTFCGEGFDSLLYIYTKEIKKNNNKYMRDIDCLLEHRRKQIVKASTFDGDQVGENLYSCILL